MTSTRSETRFVSTTDGVRIAYARHGEGPPLVFVRGWVSHLDILWRDPSYRAYFEALGRSFEVIRLDSRGNGLSDRKLTRASLADLVLDIEAIVEELELDDVILYGATFGGPPCISYAARHPERLRALILEGTFANGAAITSRIRRWILWLAFRLFPEMAFVLLSYATNPEPHRADYRRPEVIRQMIDPAAAGKLYSLAFGLDLRHGLGRVRVPTLVLHRRESQSIPIRLGREVAEGIPSARFAALDGGAHNCWEGDATASLREIHAFLGEPLETEVETAAGQPAPAVDETAAAPAAGSSTTRYQRLELLGRGGMGEVYRARDTLLGRTVALKLLSVEPGGSPHAHARFQREVRAIAQLSHPNICVVHDVGEKEGRPFLVMELLEGRTLREILNGGKPPAEQVLRWGEMAADALGFAHARDIVHRDIKPENVMVQTGGQVKILDFGLAKLMPSADAELSTLDQLTRVGATVGTWAYMAPEQARSLPVDARTDLFALGATLYELFSGRRAFARASVADTLDAILHHRPEPPGELPQPVVRILDRLLEKAPEARYQSAAHLAHDLRRARTA